GSLCFLSLAYGECHVAHTHIGRNPTWRPADWSNPGGEAVDLDPTDNDKLWFFSLPPVHNCATPGWPNWEQVNGDTFLALTPVMEDEKHITKPDDPNKVLYTCNFTYTKADGYGDPNGLLHIDGWHSAHGPQGAWNLESVDANTMPEWDIYLERERVSPNLDGDDFFTLLPDDTSTLEKNGDVYFIEKRWLEDNNAWGMHDHMGFYFWLGEDDEEVYVVLSAHDAGGMYQRSADFVIRFAKRVVKPVSGDLNGDGVVDIHDLEILIEHWGEIGVYCGDEHEPHDHDHEHDEE
ncbi:MAG: hypothetical protein PVJ60_05080, partial [Phycisphaerales bacterium]